MAACHCVIRVWWGGEGLDMVFMMWEVMRDTFPDRVRVCGCARSHTLYVDGCAACHCQGFIRPTAPRSCAGVRAPTPFMPMDSHAFYVYECAACRCESCIRPTAPRSSAPRSS